MRKHRDSLLSGNAQPDAFDGSRLHDYDVAAMCDGLGNRGTGCDTVGSGSGTTEVGNYCHSLVEGGKSDWRMPTQGEVIAVSGASKAGAYFDNGATFVGWVTNFVWTSSSSSWNVAVRIKLSDGMWGTSYKTDAVGIVCVRP